MIPYTVERRADTGVTNVALGMWLFLASEVMLFGALFSSYTLLRVSAPAWPRGFDLLHVPLGAVNTAIVVAMAALMWFARRAPVQRATRSLWMCSGAAAIFLVVKGLEYAAELRLGHAPSTSTFMAMYFVLTGTHGLHVIGGVIANVWAATGAARVGAPMTMGRVRALALYWSFVDLVWIVIFVLLYLS